MEQAKQVTADDNQVSEALKSTQGQLWVMSWGMSWESTKYCSQSRSWLPARMCLDSQNHSKYEVYRIAPLKSVRLLSSCYTHLNGSLDQDLLQEARIKWLPQIIAEGWVGQTPRILFHTQNVELLTFVFILNLEMRNIFSIILEGMGKKSETALRKHPLSRLIAWTTFRKSVQSLLCCKQRLEPLCPLQHRSL